MRDPDTYVARALSLSLTPSLALSLALSLVRALSRCQMLGPERPEAVLPDMGLYLPTFSPFLIVNKASLSPLRGHSTSVAANGFSWILTAPPKSSRGTGMRGTAARPQADFQLSCWR